MGIPNGTGGFLPTLSMRRATALCFSTTFSAIFLPTLSMRRATRTYCHLRRYDLHFYPRSPCGERPVLHASSTLAGYISTHALHAESDRIPRFVIFDKRFISTHALHAESDAALYVVSATSRIFLPTLSMRRATLHRRCDTPCHSVISTHALHAESDDMLSA